ncbi:putative adipose-regulatory protein (Seipin) [Trifolium repens]|nr:putative adipose-regulatory protein (Seipin) [Trifolium repens]
MDTINSQNDDVFFDAFHQCPFHHCSSTTDHTMPESPPSSSGHSDPDPPSSPMLRRRSIRRRSPENELPDIVSATTESQNPSIAKENENFPEKGEVFSSSQSPIVDTEEETNDESTLTTATHDEPFGDSAESTSEFSDLPSNSLDFVTGLGLVEKPFQMNQVLNFDYTKQSPVAFVPIISCPGVGGEYRSDENGGIDVDRLANKRVIPSKQKVHLTVSLLVPESGYNTKLGVFQIRVDYLSSNGKTIASSRQPCMLRFRSEPIRLITTFLKIVPLLTGYTSETQTLDAKMGDFVEGDVPTSCLKVTLEQRAEYLPGAGIPQIYDSSIFVESELPLIKRILWYWKLSLFIWIAMMAFVMELLFVLLCCWPMIIPRTRKRNGSASRTSSQNNLQAPS